MNKKQDGSCWPLSRLKLYQEDHKVYSATFLLQNFGYTKMEAETILRINVDLTYRQHSQGSGSSTCATWYILVSDNILHRLKKWMAISKYVNKYVHAIHVYTGMHYNIMCLINTHTLILANRASDLLSHPYRHDVAAHNRFNYRLSSTIRWTIGIVSLM